MSTAKFGDLARARFALSSVALERALAEQARLKALGIRRHLGQILVESRELMAEQARQILREQQKALLACPSCKVRITASGVKTGALYWCRTCGGRLVPAEGADLSSALDLPASELGASPSAPTVPPAPATGATVALPAPGSGAPAPAPSGPGHARSSDARYRTVVEIAEGGMGKVFLVQDLEMGRNVVMKLMHEHRRDADSVRRFLNEARITARLEHPNIVPVYDQSMNAAGQPYFTMKMVRGVDLGEIIAARRKGEVRYSLIRILQVFQNICDAIGYAHDQGVIHRDLKPENIMHGDYGEVFVMDWGLAKEIAKPDEEGRHHTPLLPQGPSGGMRTMDGTVVGTPAYMPPEQARGEHAAMTARSDIYSLGAILYEILTREPPYQGNGPEEILQKILAGPPRPPRAVDPDISPSLEAICLKAMDPDPAKRYAKASEISEDVQRFIEGQTVSAEQVTRWGALTRRLRRHPRAAAAAAALLFCAGVLALMAREYRAERESEEGFIGYLDRTYFPRLDRQRRDGAKALEKARALIDEAGSMADPKAALARLDEAERAAPSWEEVPMARGRVLARSGRPAEAEAAFSEVLRRRPDDVPALRARANARKAVGDSQGAAEDLARAEGLQPTLLAQAWMKGEQALRNGNPKDALAEFEKGLLLAPGEIRGRRGRAEALTRLDRTTEAIEDLAACAKAAPADASLRMALGAARAKDGDPQGAITDYEAAAELDPQHLPESRRGLLDALGIGKAEEALAAFTAYLDRHPESETPVDPHQLSSGERLVWDAMYALEARKPPAFAQAAALADWLLKRRPDDPQILVRQTEDLHKVENYPRALEGYDRLLACGPKPWRPEIQFRKAQVLLKLHRPGEAAEALNACERLLPSLDPRSRFAMDLHDLKVSIEADRRASSP